MCKWTQKQKHSIHFKSTNMNAIKYTYRDYSYDKQVRYVTKPWSNVDCLFADHYGSNLIYALW